MKKAICLVATLIMLLSSCVYINAPSRSSASKTQSARASVSGSSSSAQLSGSETDAASSSKTNNDKLQSIISSLHLDKDSYSVSHDSKRIACITCTTTANISTNTSLFIINIDDKKTVQITDFDHESILLQLSWSYDDKYLSMDNGTDVVFRTFIFDTSTLKKCFEVNSLMGSAWSYSSDAIAYSAVNSKVGLSNQDTELGFSTDVVVYNMSTKKSRTVLNANPKYYYDSLVWNKTGLSVQRNYLPKGKETVKLNISE